MEHDHIATDTCDTCKAEAVPGTQHYHLGSPVLFLCRACDPKSFDEIAREDINRWLEGQTDQV